MGTQNLSRDRIGSEGKSVCVPIKKTRLEVSFGPQAYIDILIVYVIWGSWVGGRWWHYGRTEKAPPSLANVGTGHPG